MPTFAMYNEFKNESPRIKAWTEHYMRKGCNSTKAADVAYRKVKANNTWPPK